MPAVYSYLRFSSGEQRKGDSIRRQTELRTSWLKRNDLTLDESLTIEDLGVSAWRGKNAVEGGLAAFLEAVRQKRVAKGAILLIEHLDRFSRDYVQEAVLRFLELLKAGVTIQTLEPERTYRPGDREAMPLIEAALTFANSNAQSERKSELLRQAWAGKRASGKPLTSWCPSWLRLSEDGSKYEVIPEAKATVRQIILDLSIGKDLGATAATKWLNQHKVPTISRTNRAKGKGWSYDYVAKIYNSVSLIGTYSPGIDHDGKKGPLGEVREDYFPAVLTKDEWYRHRDACERRKDHHGPPGKDKDGTANLFSGLLVNPRDGLKYARIIKNIPRLISQAFRNGVGDTQSFPYDLVETAVLIAVAEKIKLADVLGGAKATDVEDRIPLLEAELAETNTKIGQTKDQIAKRPDVDLFFDLLAELDGKRKRLAEEIETAKAAQSNQGGEGAALGELKKLVSIHATLDTVRQAHASEDGDVRQRIKAKFRQLVAEMRMVIFGRKKSKFKTAEIQIYFRAGGACSVRIANGELSGGIERVYEWNDFRRWDAPDVQEYVRKSEALWAEAADRELKYPRKVAKV